MRYDLFLGKDLIAEVKPANIEYEKNVMYMTYYMKRGNKYYLRNDHAKLVIDAIIDVDLKYGTELKITYV